ncbi:hypothetical protein GP486_008327 [Trichoglossum hirsutum]|uniref:Uncharacterized protein n=1 Tax=Trichoglossum hirsutum TaxID=265104 RepID=A0A9P8IDY1_9PEZI|nr:hypothetical protein GP486_008327 [Trichoglossum hirsutum]
MATPYAPTYKDNEHEVWQALDDWFATRPDLGTILRKYVDQSGWDSWEGYTEEEVETIFQFLRDMQVYGKEGGHNLSLIDSQWRAQADLPKTTEPEDIEIVKDLIQHNKTLADQIRTMIFGK